MLTPADVAARVAEIRRLPHDRMRDALDAWARELHQHSAAMVFLRRVGAGFCVGNTLDAVPALLGDSPAMRAVHAAVSQPRRPVRLAELMPGAPATTARSRIKAAVDEIERACPGLGEALVPTRSRDGGLTVLNAGPTLVYWPRRSGLRLMASGPFV